MAWCFTEDDMSIRYDKRQDHTVLITIDRPEARNSLDADHFRDLAQAWKDYDADDDCWVAIVTGVGPDFCVGADLKTFIPLIIDNWDGPERALAMEAVLRDLVVYKPIIAAVNGTCVAGGMEMLGGCDIRVASSNATFGVMEPKRGLLAGGGTTSRLPRQIPFPLAMEFLLCADRISARRAYEFNLVNAVVEQAELLDKAFEYAHRITVNGPLAVRATKESALRSLGAATIQDAYAIEDALATMVFSSEDAKEGPAAFAEKRTPDWRGR